jgi:hypothetical protein
MNLSEDEEDMRDEENSEVLSIFELEKIHDSQIKSSADFLRRLMQQLQIM